MADRIASMTTAGEGATARDALEAFAHGLKDSEAPLTLRLRRGKVEAHGRQPAYQGFIAERINYDPAVLAAAYKMAAYHDTGCECEVCVAIRGDVQP